jgi:alpha-D-ribose 1-methylphosphonate 5-triphosphate synthase subunit PhnL
MSEPVLSTRGLKRSFTQGDVTIEVLRGVDLDVQPGEIVALHVTLLLHQVSAWKFQSHYKVLLLLLLLKYSYFHLHY